MVVSAAVAGADRHASEAVFREQVRLLYDHLPFVLRGNLVTAAGMVVALWSMTRQDVLLGWAGAVYLLSFTRFALRRAFLRQPAEFDARRWGRIATLFSGLSGCLWGSAGLLMFQHEPLVLMTLVVVYAGMISGSVSAHSSYLPTYLAYAVPTAAPFALRCIAELDSYYATVGVLSLTFLAVNINYGRNIQRALQDAIGLRFQNIGLIDELTRQKDIAERASTDKTKFLAAASHDLRQPVQAIELFVDALDHDLKGHPSRPLVERIRAAGRGLEALLNALLDFSKVDAAAIRPEKRDFPLAEIFDRLHADFAPQAAACGLSFRVMPTAAWVHSDPAMLERILRNFAANALKYTPAGGILIGCRRAGNAFRIEVHDSGIGIPAQAQQAIFREFYQLDNPERDREKGLGLGLAIADGLARSLDHQLALRSTPGRGSTFSVSVPRGNPSPHETSAASAVTGALPGKTVLLIDDDAAIRASAAELLERWDCVAVTAESATEALELMTASGFYPNAILADYRLRGGVTGVSAIRAIQARCGALPAAILTGDTDPDRLREARDSGFPLMHKPLTAAKLRALLSNLLAG